MGENGKARVKVFRLTPGEGAVPTYTEHEIDTEEANTVLQGLFYIKDHDDDVPAYRRYQCNRGQCCSCLMTINGRPRRACVSKIEDGMVVEPLKGFPIVKDLIVDFGRLNTGYFARQGTMLEWAGHQLQAKPRFHLELDRSLCNGCQMCVWACPMNGKDNVESKYATRVAGGATLWMQEGVVNVGRFCHQCDPAACLDVCPTDALVRAASGAVMVDEEKCIGCTLCIHACPYENVTLYMERGKAVKCDLCDGHPKCVEACAAGALVLVGQPRAF